MGDSWNAAEGVPYSWNAAEGVPYSWNAAEGVPYSCFGGDPGLGGERR